MPARIENDFGTLCSESRWWSQAWIYLHLDRSQFSLWQGGSKFWQLEPAGLTGFQRRRLARWERRGREGEVKTQEPAELPRKACKYGMRLRQSNNKEKQPFTLQKPCRDWRWLTWLGASVSKVCRQWGGGSSHISRTKVEKSGECGSQKGNPWPSVIGNVWEVGVWTSHYFTLPLKIQHSIFIRIGSTDRKVDEWRRSWGGSKSGAPYILFRCDSIS